MSARQWREAERLCISCWEIKGSSSLSLSQVRLAIRAELFKSPLLAHLLNISLLRVLSQNIPFLPPKSPQAANTHTFCLLQFLKDRRGTLNGLKSRQSSRGLMSRGRPLTNRVRTWKTNRRRGQGGVPPGGSSHGNLGNPFLQIFQASYPAHALSVTQRLLSC